ncbi:MAG: dihydrofolate reductase family protein [Gammaproteobacteria bacterium]|nr:MAG: dihydrofolate reductase family protein [Gammaproteobacteria bacterium]
MQTTITRLYPPSEKDYPLQGLYLEHGLHKMGRPGRPFVYSNFIASLDGRISVAGTGRSSLEVPKAAANSRDWRLYQELAGQADVLVSSGRFFRQSAAGEAQDTLPVGKEDAFSDILEWRRQHKLPEQPAVAIISGSLDIPLAVLDTYRTRPLMVITGDQAPPERVSELRDGGIEIIFAGSEQNVDGQAMIEALDERGYRSIYAVAGPGVFRTLIEARVLGRLYLTLTHQLLAGMTFNTLTQGASLVPALGMQLLTLYHDTHAPEGASQWFSCFEPR